MEDALSMTSENEGKCRCDLDFPGAASSEAGCVDGIQTVIIVALSSRRLPKEEDQNLVTLPNEPLTFGQFYSLQTRKVHDRRQRQVSWCEV